MMLSPAFAQTDIASTSSINSLGLLTGNINFVFHPLDNAYQYSGKHTGTYYCANACMRGHHYLLDDVFLNILGAMHFIEAVIHGTTSTSSLGNLAYILLRLLEILIEDIPCNTKALAS
jgi:hypothetical protein